MRFVWGQALLMDPSKTLREVTAAVKIEGLVKRSAAKVHNLSIQIVGDQYIYTDYRLHKLEMFHVTNTHTIRRSVPWPKPRSSTSGFSW